MKRKEVLKIAKRFYAYDKTRRIAPVFTWELRRRTRNLVANNILVVGEAGIGKSYTACDLARGISPKLDPDKDVVYSYKEYLDALINRPRYVPIVFDEPSYAIGKREWYKQVNMALVKTIESQRFMGKPLFIPVINTNLLDKTIRSYLIQFRVVCVGRGRGLVYRLSASQHEDKLYRTYLCTLNYSIMDSEHCKKPTCLTCKKAKKCNIWRARYERKKERIQGARYKRELSEASEKETSELSLDEICKIAHNLKDSFTTDENKIQPLKLRVALRMNEGIIIAYNKAYELRAMLEAKHPEDYTTPK